MRQSQLFIKTRKEVPSDEVSKNAQLLIQAGFINKEMAGVYDYLPLGLKVFKKIEQIIREEMDFIGGQEMMMSALQEKQIWEKTGRWDDCVVDVWFKAKLKNDTEVGFGSTHEEPITRIMTQHIKSYKDLPFSAYQFQTKFRNETRAKSGIMRTREFVMKDMYSFHADEKSLDDFYEKASRAYEKIFERVGLSDKTFKTFASGGVFSKYSHEFQTICDAGEDTIYVSNEKNIAVNKEVLLPDVLTDIGLSESELSEQKAIEVGNIFKLGTRFSDLLGLQYVDETGEKKNVVMGCYGIGPGRLLGTIVEIFADEKGMVWPKEVAPFQVHLVRLGTTDGVISFADDLYEKLRKSGVETLYDDRDLRPGEKFSDSDLIGIPFRFVVSEKTVAENKVEIKQRTENIVELLEIADALKIVF